MLLVTADIFSGRPSPSWHVDDDNAVRFARELAILPRPAVDDAELGLGFRGLLIAPADDYAASLIGGAGPIRLAVPGAADAREIDLASALVAAAPEGLIPSGVAGRAAIASGGDVLELVRREVESVTEAQYEEQTFPPPAIEIGEDEALEDSAAAACGYEWSMFNPNWWNNDAYTKRNNNCYNYALNRVTDTFAQPGRGSGYSPASTSCAEYEAASRSDGATNIPGARHAALRRDS